MQDRASVLSWKDPLEKDPLQYSYQENPIDRGAWQATVHGVTKSRTQLNTYAMPDRKSVV